MTPKTVPNPLRCTQPTSLGSPPRFRDFACPHDKTFGRVLRHLAVKQQIMGIVEGVVEAELEVVRGW